MRFVLKNKHLKIGQKMTKLCLFNVLVPKWYLAYFVPIDGHFGQIDRYGLWTSNFFCPSLILNLIYKLILKPIRPKLAILSPKINQKVTKMAISQNSILCKCHSPKSLILLHFSMNLSETFRINVNMDFAHF